VNAHDEEEGPHSYPLNPRSDSSSSPPSFRSRSRSSSPSSRRLLHNDPLHNNEEQTLADAFGDEDESDDDNEPDDRQRLMRADPDFRAPADNAQTVSSSSSVSRADSQDQTRSGIIRRPTMLPNFTTPASGGSRQIAPSNDGVFANLNAKPERGEKNEDLPPVS